MSTRSYNYSSLASAYQCQQLYKYLYIDKIKPQVEQNGDLAFGSAVHFALENYLKDGDDIVSSFDVYWENEKKKNLEYGRYGHDALAEMGQTLLARFERLHAKKIKPLHIENRLYRNMKDVDIEGTPDVIGEFEGALSVVDFKTSGTRYHRDKVRLSEQMALYSYLYDYRDVLQFVYVVFIKGTTPSIQILKYKPTLKEITVLWDNIHTQISQLEKKAVDKETYTRNTSNCIKGEIVCPFYAKCWKGEMNE